MQARTAAEQYGRSRQSCSGEYPPRPDRVHAFRPVLSSGPAAGRPSASFAPIGPDVYGPGAQAEHLTRRRRAGTATKAGQGFDFRLAHRQQATRTNYTRFRACCLAPSQSRRSGSWPKPIQGWCVSLKSMDLDGSRPRTPSRAHAQSSTAEWLASYRGFARPSGSGVPAALPSRYPPQARQSFAHHRERAAPPSPSRLGCMPWDSSCA